MADRCCPTALPIDSRVRKALWVALVLNAVMFGVELVGGLTANSVSLLADAVDFLGDAGNYGLSLFVFGLAPIWHSRAALVKGTTMAAYGVFVLAETGWHALAGVTPEPITMGAIAVLAFAANVSVALLLYQFRGGDANMRSVWLCSRNDAIINLSVIVAALGVSSTGAAWPDLTIAVGIALLALTSARSVIAQSLVEMERPAYH